MADDVPGRLKNDMSTDGAYSIICLKRFQGDDHVFNVLDSDSCKRISDVVVLPACRSYELPSIISISVDQTCTGNAPTHQSSTSEHFIQTCM